MICICDDLPYSNIQLPSIKSFHRWRILAAEYQYQSRFRLGTRQSKKFKTVVAESRSGFDLSKSAQRANLDQEKEANTEHLVVGSNN